MKKTIKKHFKGFVAGALTTAILLSSAMILKDSFNKSSAPTKQIAQHEMVEKVKHQSKTAVEKVKKQSHKAVDNQKAKNKAMMKSFLG